ncbi:hypothetical protein ACFXOD_28770 [Streptomyces sp. NPDC059161]|uniref:hypothetical protein n=1 Tax=Streptomyces sp. NPDC059161 TaxID=3346749 RepID=UPI003684FF9F
METVDRRADRDRMAVQQLGDLRGGLAPAEQADAFRPLPCVSRQIPPRQQFTQTTTLIVSQLDTEDVRHDVPLTRTPPQPANDFTRRLDRSVFREHLQTARTSGYSAADEDRVTIRPRRLVTRSRG